MAEEPTSGAEAIQVTATAHASRGSWQVCLVGAPEISVHVARLADVDRAVAVRLARDLGRDDVPTLVHIRWYDAVEPLPWLW